MAVGECGNLPAGVETAISDITGTENVVLFASTSRQSEEPTVGSLAPSSGGHSAHPGVGGSRRSKKKNRAKCPRHKAPPFPLEKHWPDDDHVASGRDYPSGDQQERAAESSVQGCLQFVLKRPHFKETSPINPASLKKEKSACLHYP